MTMNVLLDNWEGITAVVFYILVVWSHIRINKILKLEIKLHFKERTIKLSSGKKLYDKNKPHVYKPSEDIERNDTETAFN